MKNTRRFSGIITPLATPINKNGDLDVEAVEKLVEHCIADGVSGLFVNGSAGEAMRLSEKTWEENMRSVLHANHGRVPVLCGAIDTSATRAVEKIKKIEQSGGEIAVCTPPFYLNSFGQDEILRHYEIICNSTDVDIAVYNIPDTTHVCIQPETIARLADYDRIVLFKDSSGDWRQMQTVLQLIENKDIAVFCGAEDICGVSMLFGASGCVPVLSNFVPELFVNLYDVCKQGNITKSFEMQGQINEIRQVLFVNGCWISGLKFLLKAFSLGTDGISSGLLNLTYEQESKVLNILRRNGIHI